MSCSFRLKGSLRVHGIPHPTEEIYKNISKMLTQTLLAGKELDHNIEGVICLCVYNEIRLHHCLIREGVSEKGTLYILFSDVDKRGFSSLILDKPVQKSMMIEKKIQGNVISPNRQHQVRLVFQGRLTISPFDLKYWDDAVQKGFHPVIPPTQEWVSSIKLNIPLSKSLTVGMTKEKEGKTMAANTKTPKFLSLLGRTSHSK